MCYCITLSSTPPSSSAACASKDRKAEELVGYLKRRNRLSQLIAVGTKTRPDVLWRRLPLAAVEASFTVETIPPENLCLELGPEVQLLEKRGFIEQTPGIPGGWRVRPAAFLWWLVDKAGWLKSGSAPLIKAVAEGK